MNNRKTITRRTLAITLAVAIILSLLSGLFIGHIVFAAPQTVELSVETPNGIVLSDASASLVYNENGKEMVLLTISTSNDQVFDFVEVEWSKDPFFTENVLHWGAEKHTGEKETVTNEVVDFDGDVIYVRIRATINGVPSDWSDPTEITIRETIDEDPITSDPVNTQEPTNGNPVNTQEPVVSNPPATESNPMESNPVESNPVESNPVETSEPVSHTHTVATRTIRTVAPTCLQTGIVEVETYCTECNQSLNIESTTLDALGHDYREIERVEPQIGKTGYVVYECSRCGDKYTVTLPALVDDHEHNYTVTVNIKAATCTESGVVKIFCSCGAFIEEHSNPLGHKMGSWYVVVEATANSEGMEKRDCARCDYSETRKTSKTDAPHTHNVESKTIRTIEATCLQNGVIEVQYFCTECHTIIDTISNTIPALGHDYEEIARLEPQIGQTGYIVYECNRCGDKYTITLPALIKDHTHAFVTRVVVTPATCTEGGVEKLFCTCGGYVEHHTNALGHNMGEWYTVKAATENEHGMEQRDCSRCDYNETRETATMGHTHNTVTRNGETIPATCTTNGYKTVETVCVSCNEIVNVEVITLPALGHNMGEWYTVKAATENEHGMEQRDCSRCDYNETRETATMGHTHNTVTRNGETVAATCISDGYKTVETVCVSCNETINVEIITLPALGHDMGEWYVVVEPTTETTGIEQRDCSRCEYSETREINKIPVDTSNCGVLIQTMTQTTGDFINFTILGRDVDAVRIEVSNGIESDVMYGTVPCTSNWSAHNFTSKVWTTGGTFTANVTGYKLIDGEMVEVAYTSFSINVTLNNETNDNDTNNNDANDTSATETTEIVETTETVETVEIVETVETVETIAVETLTVDLEG